MIVIKIDFKIEIKVINKKMEEDKLKPYNIRECKWGKGRECWADAYHLWITMKFKGTIVSGYRDFDRENNSFPHYWMELGNFVYTIGLCELENKDTEWVLLTYKKDEYYNHHNIIVNKIETEDESLKNIVELKKRGYM